MNTEELKNLFEKLKKDKKTLLVIAVGLIGMLLILLSDSGSDKEYKSSQILKENYDITSEQELSSAIESLIEAIDGAGKCKVMVTYKSYDERVYAIDKDENINAQGERDCLGEYVILDSGDKEEGLKLKMISPEIKGVAVVCQGGNNPVVKEQITISLSALFDISSNKISVAVMAK